MVGANILMMPAASGLFLIRLNAVYSRDRGIMSIFGFCWLVILALFVYESTDSLLQFEDVTRDRPCAAIEYNTAWAYIATAVYDTLLYLAVSWRLASFSTSNIWHDRLQSFFTGDGLGWLSKVLLRSGQVYYL